MSTDDRDPRPQRRTDERLPISLRVDYDDAADLVSDYTANLSTGGACIASSRSLAVGTEIRLALAFPGLLEPIRVRAIVRWCKGGDEPTLGVEFDDAAARDALAAAITRIQAGDPKLVTQVLRVLIVEDNRHVAELLGNGLGDTRRFGPDVAVECHYAADGGAALETLRHHTFQILIVDVYLPVLDGPKLIAAIRDQEKRTGGDHVLIIAVSAGGTAAENAAMQAGADTFLDKPMRLRGLVDTMRSIMKLDAPPV